MKFGKHIQSHQVPGWSAYYLDYKFLKKIISSLAANRPASEAAALAAGLRPLDTNAQAPLLDASKPPLFATSEKDEERGAAYQAHKAAFFFKLERELEKINTFYLQKEAELKLRLETLLSKRRAAAMRGMPDAGDDGVAKRAEWSAVEEGFRLLERDLGKLQQFVDINATGFRKILKKFDKRSTSTTKELYLARQVDVQPVFNRQLISELSDTVAACLLDLTDLSAGIKFEGPGANDIFTQQILAERAPYSGPFSDLEKNLRNSIARADTTAITDCCHYSDILAQDSEAKTNVARILWSVVIEAPPDLADLILASLSTPFDYCFVDDINGRTCLHEAAIAGTARLVDICIEKGVQVDKLDVYNRNALHYAAMHGHASICRRLLATNIPLTNVDVDNYSPLIYAILKGSVNCVRVLLDHGAVQAHPTPPVGDVIPLSLASQSGHVEVVKMLLQLGARCLSNSNGEFPMHLAAREGHVAVCRLLLRQPGWDTPDKYHEWTPLFHAVRYGRVEVAQVLLDAGARPHIKDELGHQPVHYAAWYGHQECLKLLLSAPSRDVATIDAVLSDVSPLSDGGGTTQSEIDLIPSLSLPPPIIPHRVYGHNYLDRTNLVHISIEGSTGVRLHHRLISPAFRDEYAATSAPLKLVITTSPEVNSGPFTMSLPGTGENDVFIFQIESLESLDLEFSVHPNFGTKTIGRAVALPSLFTGLDSQKSFTLPILDHRLHVIGEVTFEVRIITAFEGVTLEVGGDVETYWKSSTTSTVPASLLPYRSHFGSAQTSPSAHSITSMQATGPATIVSSLKGRYLPIVVQVTRDLHPVVFPRWFLPVTGLNLTVSDVDISQFEALASKLGKDDSLLSKAKLDDLPTLVSESMTSLAKLLTLLPPKVSIDLELAYPSRVLQKKFIGQRKGLNEFVDAVLRAIYHSPVVQDGRMVRRRLVFSSFSEDVCAALNWKQPNYPVFLLSYCGLRPDNTDPSSTAHEGYEGQAVSLGSVVEFARMNNLLGVIVPADLLLQIPSLVNGIRSAGLLVGILNASESNTVLTTNSGVDGCPVDAYGSNGYVVYVP